mmetsp:Transcript_71036/g.141113  ORF Transcript_71036/g.141113 Transcript_71036/m.141113 type:complete len:200 (+) Transcript_71036:527-1126(+)
MRLTTLKMVPPPSAGHKRNMARMRMRSRMLAPVVVRHQERRRLHLRMGKQRPLSCRKVFSMIPRWTRRCGAWRHPQNVQGASWKKASKNSSVRCTSSWSSRKRPGMSLTKRGTSRLPRKNRNSKANCMAGFRSCGKGGPQRQHARRASSSSSSSSSSSRGLMLNLPLLLPAMSQLPAVELLALQIRCKLPMQPRRQLSH